MTPGDAWAPPVPGCACLCLGWVPPAGTCQVPAWVLPLVSPQVFPAFATTWRYRYLLGGCLPAAAYAWRLPAYTCWNNLICLGITCLCHITTPYSKIIDNIHAHILPDSYGQHILGALGTYLPIGGITYGWVTRLWAATKYQELGSGHLVFLQVLCLIYLILYMVLGACAYGLCITCIDLYYLIYIYGFYMLLCTYLAVPPCLL